MHPQLCYICERYSTTDRSHLTRHQQKCRDKYYCARCPFKSTHRKQIENHFKKQLDVKIYTCKLCKTYKTKKLFNFKRHSINCLSNLQCVDCDYKTSKKSHLILHLKKKHNAYQLKCNHCKNYKTKRVQDYGRHVAQCKRVLSCSHCDYKSSEKSAMEQHMKLKSHSSIFCHKCEKLFASPYYFNQHTYCCNKQTTSDNTMSVQVALNKKFKIMKFSNFKMKADLKKTLYLEMQEKLRELIEKEANEKMGVKWKIALQALLYKPTDGDELNYAAPVFTSPLFTAVPYESVTQLEEAFENINNKVELFCNLGSGWIHDEVQRIDLYIAQNNPLSGSSFIPTPKKFAHKKYSNVLLNIENKKDDLCFKYCVLAKVLQLRDTNPSIYQEIETEINFSGLNFPVEVRQIDVFERKNCQISISVFGYENNELFPLKISASPNRKHHLDLLLITKNLKCHYILIYDKNLFFKYVLRPNNFHRLYTCDYCLNFFKSNTFYQEHVVQCQINSPQVTKYPTKNNNILKFKSFNKKLKRPIVIYSDFETMDINGEFVPSSYAYLIVDDTHSPLILREHCAAQGVINHYLTSIQNDVAEILKTRVDHENIIWTPEDRKLYEEATCCHICEEPFDLSITNPDHPKSRVADHYHFEFKHTKHTMHNRPGYLRGAAHRECNATFQTKLRVPVVFHNLKNFDAHLIIKEIGPFINQKTKFRCIPQTIEKYLTFSLGNLDFIDSLQFLNASLETLVATLEPSQMKLLKHYYPTDEHFKLLCRKGVFPYSYIDSYSKLEDITELPSRDAFYDKLNENPISESDYEHAKTVWETFNCKTLGEYQSLYNKCDTIILGDIFECFREVIMKYYALDPCNYVSSPGMAWDAMLKMTKVNLELVSDPAIYLMFESAIRGGFSCISQRYQEAIPGKSSLLYIDCNNLYAVALSSYLPVSDFEFITTDSLTKVLNTPDDSKIGYICEVDLQTPEHLHDYMNDFPLAPSKETIPLDKLSPFQINLLKELNCTYKPTEKLIASLEPKKNYILHYRNLKLYLQLGMKLTHVHKILQFKQDNFMKPFIDFNTQKRAEATSKFSQDLFKLLSNSVYGRTLMDVRRHENFRLINDEKIAKKYIRKTTFKQFSIFNNDLVGVMFMKTKVELKNPIFIGMAVLDISKVVMYDYYYNVLKRKYQDTIILCLTDTDSFLYYLQQSCDIKTELMTLMDTLDTSNYPKDHILYSDKNKKVIGKFKDESPNDPIVRFCGIRSKMYSYVTRSMYKKNVGKGVPKKSLKKINFDDYKNSLFNAKEYYTQFQQISSHNHSISIKSLEKKSLSPFDDKRYLLSDKISTLAYGHHRIKELENI